MKCPRKWQIKVTGRTINKQNSIQLIIMINIWLLRPSQSQRLHPGNYRQEPSKKIAIDWSYTAERTLLITETFFFHKRAHTNTMLPRFLIWLRRFPSKEKQWVWSVMSLRLPSEELLCWGWCTRSPLHTWMLLGRFHPLHNCKWIKTHKRLKMNAF